MNRQELMNVLPHREDMLLLDAAELLEDGSARGAYTVKGDEFFLRGHFPGNPIMPGVIQCEIIAQTAALLMQNALQGCTPFYAGIDKVRFRRPVRPGDTLEVRATLLRHKLSAYVVSGEAFVDGQKTCSGEFTFMLVPEA